MSPLVIASTISIVIVKLETQPNSEPIFWVAESLFILNDILIGSMKAEFIILNSH